MARIAGRNGRLYANLTSGGTAEPIQFLEQLVDQLRHRPDRGDRVR